MLYKTDEYITEDNYKKFEKDLDDLYKSQENIIIDMENTIYISSAALRVLIVYCRRLGLRKRKLKIINAQPLVYDVFNVTGLLDLLEISIKEEKKR